MILRLLTAAVLIPVFLAVIFLAPLWVLVLVVDVLILGAVWEYRRIVAGYGVAAFRILYPLALLLPWFWAYRPNLVMPWILLSILCLSVRALYRFETARQASASASFSILGFLYAAVPMSIVCDFHFLGTGGTFWAAQGVGRGTEILMILVTIWVSDSGAYFGGKAFGKTRIVPQLSPSKSLEGYVCGLVLGILAAYVYGNWYLPGRPAWWFLVAGSVVVLSGMLGDLFESLLKRGAGVKDSSGIIPGHGGVLDRLDSLLFAFPAYFILLALLK